MIKIEVSINYKIIFIFNFSRVPGTISNEQKKFKTILISKLNIVFYTMHRYYKKPKDNNDPRNKISTKNRTTLNVSSKKHKCKPMASRRNLSKSDKRCRRRRKETSGDNCRRAWDACELSCDPWTSRRACTPRQSVSRARRSLEGWRTALAIYFGAMERTTIMYWDHCFLMGPKLKTKFGFTNIYIYIYIDLDINSLLL